MEHTLGVGSTLLELAFILVVLENLLPSDEGSEHKPKLSEYLWLREGRGGKEGGCVVGRKMKYCLWFGL